MTTAASKALEVVRAAKDALSDQARHAAVERQHKLGKLTARERVAALVDHGSFHEVGALVQPKRDVLGTENLQAPADGVLAGYASIDGRAVGLCAFDFTVLGGSNGRVGEHKVERIAAHCLEHGCAFVLLLDGGGHRIQEGLDSRHFAEGSRYFQIAANLSGWVPTVAVVMGPGFAGPSNFAALCDFVVMVRDTSTMGIAGPALVAAATGEVADKDTLGGASTQADRNGLADLVAESDDHALQLVRDYLSYMPANAAAAPQLMAPIEPALSDEERLVSVLPDNTRHVYDVREVIRGVCDGDSGFELKPTFAPNLVTSFARLAGRPVGIIANQALHMGGTLDAKACEKGAHFISLCDAFGLPLVYLVDVPGFLVGSAAEDSALARRSGRLLFELAQATVPRLSVIMRKGYGLAYIAMCGGRSFDADLCVAWPTAEICAMSVEGAVDVAYAKQVAASPDPKRARDALIQQIRERLGSLHAAEHFGIDDVIDPLETRAALIATLERCQQRKHGRQRSPRLHGISPI